MIFTHKNYKFEIKMVKEQWLQLQMKSLSGSTGFPTDVENMEGALQNMTGRD